MTSKSSLAIVFFAMSGFIGAGTAISACVGDDGAPTTNSSVTDDGGGSEASANAALKANGLACGAAGECQTGQCSDGVCCEAKCDGICEKCNLPGTVGQCAPVPTGQDPDNECTTTPLPTTTVTESDAGTTNTDNDASVDGGDFDAGSGDAGLLFNLPDGGYPTTNDTACAGKCNGARACAYPGTETSCGTAFCGNASEQGVASCDTKGHCLYGVVECSAYTCPDGSAGCKTSCTKAEDCLTGFFCDGTSQTCKPKLANGTSCTDVTQCTSGVCDTNGGGGICCDSDCTGVAGGSCRSSGKVGQCTCSACTTGPCAIFYKDADGDGHGNAAGTVTDGTAVYGCADTAPVGFVASHDDCLDSTVAIAASVHPGQTGWFTSPYLNGQGQQSYDYDCSGGFEKQYAETNNCGYCYFESFQEHANVNPNLIRFGFCGKTATCSSTTAVPGRSCLSGSCGNINSAGFLTAVGCGVSASSYDCSPCAAVNGNAQENSYAGQLAQGCH